MFFENPLGTFLSPIHVLPNCKVSEKVMNGFREISGRTDEQTDERTRAKFNVLTN